MRPVILAVILAVLPAAIGPAFTPALATSHDRHQGHGAGAVVTAEADGEVRRVDVAAGKVTLRHGPIDKLDMAGMSMVFPVRDPASLRGPAAGDRVRFELESNHGALTVIAIRKLP